ncbi:branched-chain amino acid transport system II carrier protein [Rickettsiales endosymbiont of Stachyamoeba lipophora]|uniref:branched-chain amino acid transport system II carrier protein n=1 Tax=Rickettsiales endosymbiont of Stachyamoeba lipophora TaxID=2486578 RepID=UPI0013DDF169|nr:branched-chain amino acid transport system II carrier protein [Rickettsiales endosymbiont of Stachyamoeba lipophora]
MFCEACFLVCLRDRLMISILGKWLAPILLIGLIFLIVLGVIQAPVEAEIIQKSLTAFPIGFFRGYQTMDLFAAFFFSALVFNQLQSLSNHKIDEKAINSSALKSSLIGASLLALIYIGFIFLGAHYL